MVNSDRKERSAKRKKRLATQLRDNLKKRKQQARARSSQSDHIEEEKTATDDRSDDLARSDPQNKDDE